MQQREPIEAKNKNNNKKGLGKKEKNEMKKRICAFTIVRSGERAAVVAAEANGAERERGIGDGRY